MDDWQAVANELNVSPDDFEVVENKPSAGEKESSAKAWAQSGATAVETAHHQSLADSQMKEPVDFETILQ